MRKTRVLVAGSRGYVGSQIARALDENPFYEFLSLCRGQDDLKLFAKADIIIHAANPARRYFAEQNPKVDFIETVEKTHRFLSLSQSKRFILISSLSCRTQLHLSYGIHRRECEDLALAANGAVIRLGPMFGGARTQDVLHDILASRMVYISEKTKYAYADVAVIAKKVVDSIENLKGISEFGARNSIELGEIARRYESNTVFSGPIDTQIPENCFDGPDAYDVIKYADIEFSRMNELKKKLVDIFSTAKPRAL